MRYLAYSLLESSATDFPWATLFVNLTGSLLLAVVAVLITHQKITSDYWQFGLSAGLLASFTTFSNFSLDILHLMESSGIELVLIYVLSSVIGGGMLTYAGWVLTKKSIKVVS